MFFGRGVFGSRSEFFGWRAEIPPLSKFQAQLIEILATGLNAGRKYNQNENSKIPYTVGKTLNTLENLMN